MATLQVPLIVTALAVVAVLLATDQFLLRTAHESVAVLDTSTTDGSVK
jgi:hypothetical protein